MIAAQAWALLADAESPDAALAAVTEIDPWPYRDRTVGLLKRYGRASVELGRLPSLLGRECFRARLSSYPMASFEDIVIFVHDMEMAVNKLGPLEKRLLAMNVLEEYTHGEIARLMGCTRRWIEFRIPEAIDELTCILLKCGLMRRMAWADSRRGGCQRDKNGVFSAGNSING
ncbi:MAG: sigma-70 region 4 domain-containing protein [Acidobacteriia bacterium]|nr:sigma-70 region 4 domain-containing protein [Terriglobia bacterium]